MPISDHALIARAVAQRDPHAFAQLVLRYQSQLRVWARRLTNGDTHLADDLAQETFIKAHSALSTFRGDAKFSSWLYRIAFNLAASRWRTKRIEWCSLEESADVEAQSCGIRDFAAKKDVESAMAQLTQAQQLAIQLCYEEGFSHSEIANIMGIPIGTVKTHILRGKNKLEQLLTSWRETL